MSDCHSWFGAARSNRRGGCSRAPVASGASVSSPSSCRMRRTSVSETPSASKRASTSRMRRVPCSGCCCRSATTARRRASVTRVRIGLRCPGSSASAPPPSYSASQFWIVPMLGPSMRETSAMLDLPFSTASTTRSRNANGYPMPGMPGSTGGGRYGLFCFPSLPRLFITVLPSGLLPADEGDRC